MPEQFVSESLTPVPGAFDALAMSAGSPGLPSEFFWRHEKVAIAGILRSWRETGACHHGSGEMYVRKHWFEVDTLAHGVMKIYFERQARHPVTARWWLYLLMPERRSGGQRQTGRAVWFPGTFQDVIVSNILQH